MGPLLECRDKILCDVVAQDTGLVSSGLIHRLLVPPHIYRLVVIRIAFHILEYNFPLLPRLFQLELGTTVHRHVLDHFN